MANKSNLSEFFLVLQAAFAIGLLNGCTSWLPLLIFQTGNPIPANFPDLPSRAICAADFSMLNSAGDLSQVRLEAYSGWVQEEDHGSKNYFIELQTKSVGPFSVSLRLPAFEKGSYSDTDLHAKTPEQQSKSLLTLTLSSPVLNRTDTSLGSGTSNAQIYIIGKSGDFLWGRAVGHVGSGSPRTYLSGLFACQNTLKPKETP
ncbi:MAG: hypothetical protein ACAI44_18820 [Candidatus Sericytochromatia bacterium]